MRDVIAGTSDEAGSDVDEDMEEPNIQEKTASDLDEQRSLNFGEEQDKKNESAERSSFEKSNESSDYLPESPSKFILNNTKKFH